MYMFNPDELRSIHEERVGFLRNLFAKTSKEDKREQRKSHDSNIKSQKRDDNNK